MAPIVTLVAPSQGILSTVPYLSMVLHHVSRNQTARSTNPEHDADMTAAPIIGGTMLAVLAIGLGLITWLLVKYVPRTSNTIVLRNIFKFRSRTKIPVVATTQPEGLRFTSHSADRQAAQWRAEDAGQADLESGQFVRLPLYGAVRELPPVYGAWVQPPRRPVASQLAQEPGESRANILPPIYSAM